MRHIILATALLSAVGTAQAQTLFTDVLTKEYERIAAYEAEEMSDMRSSALFSQKSLAAATGARIEPELLKDWPLPEEPLPELRSARKSLVALFDFAAREELPAEAAKAQAGFDCWVEQQEENWQFDHIAKCRNSFYTALAKIQGELAPMATVLFKLDRAVISEPGKAALDKLVDDLEKFGDSALIVIDGHADSSGADVYNHDLSRARALAAWRELMELGVAPARLAIRAFGERRPIGADKAKNRRVEATIRLETPPAIFYGKSVALVH